MVYSTPKCPKPKSGCKRFERVISKGKFFYVRVSFFLHLDIIKFCIILSKCINDLANFISMTLRYGP